MLPQIPIQHSSLKWVHSLIWSEVFGIWKQSEAYQESWREHWTERGFNSWEEWRESYAAPLHPRSLSWNLYRVGKPPQEAPLFFGTPTAGWRKHVYGEESTMQIKDILKHPIISANDKVLAIIEDFPRATMLTGLIHKDRIVLIEGMHRTCALALWNPDMPFTRYVSIALAQWSGDLPILGGNYKQT